MSNKKNAGSMSKYDKSAKTNHIFIFMLIECHVSSLRSTSINYDTTPLICETQNHASSTNNISNCFFFFLFFYFAPLPHTLSLQHS